MSNQSLEDEFKESLMAYRAACIEFGLHFDDLDKSEIIKQINIHQNSLIAIFRKAWVFTS